MAAKSARTSLELHHSWLAGSTTLRTLSQARAREAFVFRNPPRGPGSGLEQLHVSSPSPQIALFARWVQLRSSIYSRSRARRRVPAQAAGKPRPFVVQMAWTRSTAGPEA